MYKIPLGVFTCLLFLGFSCSVPPTSKVDPNSPDLCQMVMGEMPIGFPEGMVMPGSWFVAGTQFGMEEETYDVSHDGYLVTFCIKATTDEIFDWYNTKHPDWKYATMETAHYWTLGDEESLMLDLVSQGKEGWGDYTMYSVDVRTYQL